METSRDLGGVLVMQKSVTVVHQWSCLPSCGSWQYRTGEKRENMWGKKKLEIAKGPFDSIKRPFCLTAEVIMRVW